MKRTPLWLIGLLAIVAMVVLFVGLLYIPVLTYPPISTSELNAIVDVEKRIALEQAQIRLQNDVRSTLLQGLVGLLLAVGGVATWRQVQISRHGQITDRINKAVDHLAGDKVEARLGGIYSLERVAKDSLEDRPTITAILTAFIRTHSPAHQRTASGHQHEAVEPHCRTMRLGQRAEDVQTALYVLAHRPRSGEKRPLYLSWTDLSGARMGNRDWRHVICFDSYLAGAWLANARLDNATLDRSDLRHADLTASSLVNASVVGAHLEGASLRDADLRGADLSDTCLGSADLAGVRTDARTKWPAGFKPAHMTNAAKSS